MADPTLTKFDPKQIQWQWEATKYIRDFDYNSGTLEVFYSGGVGSAKTMSHIHEIVVNCIEQSNSKWLMVRRTLKDLKRTSWKKLINHIADVRHLVKEYNKTEMRISFINGSEILGDSYDDGDETKFQSLDLSGLDIEEAKEMPENIYMALKLRLGRAGVLINRIQLRSNPDSPSHWLYKYFIETKDIPNRAIFYSLTEQNPFLKSWYIENLRRDLDPKMARRNLYGEWIEINREIIYSSYSSQQNFKNIDYEINKNLPIIIAFDFNIGNNKPMSSCAMQFDGNAFHIFDEVILSGGRTHDAAEAWIEKKVVTNGQKILIRGDATGGARDTRSILSDYDILQRAFSNAGAIVEMQVPKSNAPIRTRHNIVNAYCKNEAGEVRFFVYKKCKTVDQGMRLAALKKNNYIEDDSKPYQHVTTAAGYAIIYEHNALPIKTTINNKQGKRM